jgi:hypothetical protein
MRFSDIRKNPNPTDQAIMSAPVRRVERKHGLAITGLIDEAWRQQYGASPYVFHPMWPETAWVDDPEARDRWP